MDRRVFLGCDRPFLGAVVDWLWARRDELPGMVVVVPTAQGGRRLRQALAEKGACLAPRVVTPGWFLETDCAPQGAEVLAWVETLESIKDWKPHASVFPIPPGQEEGAGWSLGLATALAGLERSLQEAALTPETAARRLRDMVESERWAGLARLWRLKEQQLSGWGLQGRSQQLECLAREPVRERIVLAGVPDLPEAAVQRLAGASFTCLIAAPEGPGFDPFGRPVPEVWVGRPLPLPPSVTLVADARQQAQGAVEKVAAAGTPADDLALGSADDAVAAELVRSFGRSGWILHHPGARVGSPSRVWLGLWRAWLHRPQVAEAIDLLGARETSVLCHGLRAQRAQELSRLRDEELVRTPEDVERSEARSQQRDQRQGRPPIERRGSETLARLVADRQTFLGRPFPEAMAQLIPRIDPEGTWSDVREWLRSMGPVLGAVQREATFWLELMVRDLGETAPEPPEGRVGDVMGWLELLHAPGSHLVVCGMNEGQVPASPGADPWLSDRVRELLGMTGDRRRAARDAHLFEALVSSRRRVDLLLGRTGGDGEALMPSRLLLAAEGEELARRVERLFREVEPAGADEGWHPQWRWTPPKVDLKPRLSVTALGDYLTCPYRFHLRHGAGLQAREPERVEWNARNFGTVVHLVLERWGGDPTIRDSESVADLESWLLGELDRVVQEYHGTRPPLALRIQIEGARQRLRWFARHQARIRTEGWRVQAVETKFESDIDGVVLVGKVDRIDRHADGRVRVLDYKTYASMKEVEREHRTEMRSNTVLPAHLVGVDEVLGQNPRGKQTRWTNLQVPLYAAFIPDVRELGYFILGESEGEVGLSLWEGFRPDDRDSALRCAKWVVGCVKARRFGPPADRVVYDAFEVLGMGRRLADLVEVAS